MQYQCRLLAPAWPELLKKNKSASSKTRFFEGFMPNGLQIRNLHKMVRALARVKIDFGAKKIIIITFCQALGA